MTIRNIFLAFILTCLLFTLTGCYSTLGIDRQYFVISIGLDVLENDMLKVSIQIPSTEENSKSSDSSQASNYQIYSVESETIDEALSVLNNYLNKKINLSHCSSLIISEELAKKGLETYINTLTNNSELRHSCEILISNTTALEVLEKISNAGEIFSARLFEYLSVSSQYTGYTIRSTFGDFFHALDNDYNQPATIYVSTFDDTVQTNGIAIFKDSTMIGHIDVSNSIAHLIVKNELDLATISIENPFEENELLDLDISLYKDTQISIDIINGTPLISLIVYPEGTIKSSGGVFNYIDNEKISKVEKAATEYLDRILKDYLYTISHKYNSDIASFKEIYQSSFFTKEEFEKVHWDKIFQDSFFNIEFKTKINSSNLFNKE